MKVRWLRFRRLLIGGGIDAVVAAVLVAEENLRGSLELQSYRKTLAARGEKLTVAELSPIPSAATKSARDLQAADFTQLCLPETGACTSQFDRTGGDASPGCCGEPAPDDVDACCLADVEARTTKGEGCGCGAPVASSHRAVEPV